MSEYERLLTRIRKTTAGIHRLEERLSQDPQNRSTQINLASRYRLLKSHEAQMDGLCKHVGREISRYAIKPIKVASYGLADVSSSLHNYQMMFSQIYDAKKNGKKDRGKIGREALEASQLDFGYTFSGSLGVALTIPSERSLLGGNLDNSIDALYDLIRVENSADVRSVAEDLGYAVVTRLHNWANANKKAGFAVDMRWSRTDGRELAEVIPVDRMENVADLISKAEDEKTVEERYTGFLVGADTATRSFHFVVPDGQDFKGKFARDYTPSTTIKIGGARYRALIRTTSKYSPATDKTKISYELLDLSSDPISVRES